MAKSLSQATAAALNNLGTDKNQFDTDLSAVEQACADFILRVKENIQAIPDFVNSGAIENLSIEVGEQEVNIMGSPHLLYQNYGVNGAEIQLYDTPYSYKDKKPPVDAFLEYIQSKNIRLVNNPRYYGNPSPFASTSEDKQQLQVAWAMATKVYEQGFKPRPIKWEEEKDKLVQDLKNNVAGFYIKQIKTEIYNQYGQNIESKAS